MRIYSYRNDPGTSTPNGNKKKTLFRRGRKKINLRKITIFAFRFLAVSVFIAAVLFLYYAKDLPDPNKLLERDVPESTKIYARDNSLLYEIHGEYKRTLVNLDQISPFLKNATLAVEDKDFYKHGGISLTGILRAGLQDVLHLKLSQGGSTITQQFVKNAILNNNKSWDRKIREAILSVAIDARFSKDQIFQLYLNEIPYGRNSYGVEAAAQTYFGKAAKDLDLTESAYLSALPQAPTYYNPSGPNRQALDNRKNTILALMKEQGYINADQQKQAKDEKVSFSTITTGIKAPHFVLWVQNYLADKYGEKTLSQGGLKVYTTLDPKLQSIAEDAVKTNIAKESKKYNANNAALVAIDPKTGQVLAMVGSKDYFGKPEPEGCNPGKNCRFEPNVNVALSQRQPGSSFKPYVYVTAFKKDFGYAPASMLMDVVTNFGSYNGKDYVPQNYNGQSYGPLSMRKAMAGSLNVPAVKTLDLIGVNNATQTAHDLGITSPLADCGLSLVLGGCEVRLLDHVAAYSALANGGIKNPMTPILKIQDKDGKTLEEFKAVPQQVLDSQAVYELTSIMTDNNARSFIFGLNSPLILPDRLVAAKTGTTNNWHDGWTLGFTPSLAAGVWVGNNDGTLLKKGADGVLVAAPIWHDFMQQALNGTAAEDFAAPPGIQKVIVDEVSGKLPTDATPSTKEEVFADYSVPTTYDNVHQKIAIDSQTGLPATNLTPPSQIIYKIYTVLHGEKPNNPNWETPVKDWALTHGYSYPPDNGQNSASPASSGRASNPPQVEILAPEDGAAVTQMPFEVTVNAVSDNAVVKTTLSINGELYQTLTSRPFVFNVNKALSAGNYTLAVHVVDSLGQVADTSSSFNYEPAPPISISQPLDKSLLNFPVSLTAASNNLYDLVNFYYQDSKGRTKLIGAGVNIDHVSQYHYSLTWKNRPAAGNYKIFAQTSTGETSVKISVTVP